MFYEPGRSKSGLPYNPFKSCCVPRPIGWISTVSVDGANNLAPFSQFQNLTWDPPTVMVAVNCKEDGSMKDTAANILRTHEFVWNMATYDQRDQVVGSAQVFPAGVDEFEQCGIASVASQVVAPKRVAASPIHFECRLTQSLFIPGNTPAAGTHLLIAQVVGIHIDEAFVREDGFIDILKIRPLARIGYHDYIAVDSKFELTVPDFKGHSNVPYLSEPISG